MLKPESKAAVEVFLKSARKELDAFLDSLSNLTYEAAVELILDAQSKGNRLHVTGIGKPGHVATYIAGLLSSVGNPCYYLHGTEAIHGSCGQLAAGDVVIAISNSGETAEMKAAITAVKNNGCSVIGVSGNEDSWLARESDVFLYAGVREEGGPLNRVPRNSVTAEILTLQALSVVLQAEKGWDSRQYVRCHPGGKLGKLREGE